MNTLHPDLTEFEIKTINHMITNDRCSRKEIYSYLGLRFEEMRELWIRSVKDCDDCQRGWGKIGNTPVLKLWAAHFTYMTSKRAREEMHKIKLTAEEEKLAIVLAKIYDREGRALDKLTKSKEDIEFELYQLEEELKLKSKHSSDDVLTAIVDKIDLRGRGHTDKKGG